MKTVKSTDFQNSPGLYQDMARVEPIVITKHNRPSLVLLSFLDYQKLTQKEADKEYVINDHVVPQEVIMREMGHAARAAEGRTAWAAAWTAAWAAADHAANNMNNKSYGGGRGAWAAAIVAARDSAPPPASDAGANKQWNTAWATAWTAAWAAAMIAAKVVLEERKNDKDQRPQRAWDTKSREERMIAGSAAGCAAWNETYRTEIKK